MERLLEIKKSALELFEYLRATVARLRRTPENNIMSELARVEEKGDILTEDELLANAIFLLIAGHETTTNLIANGILSLLREPSQLQRLCDDPSLLPSAVEEFLRFEGPLQMVGRVTKEQVEIGGTTINPGQVIALVLGSANRDPKAFVDPDRLDIGRKENRHLGLSVGAHYCIGATLARIEGQIAIGSMLRRFPAMSLEPTTLDWQQNLSFRGLRALPVTF
jgi:cytochrome P450